MQTIKIDKYNYTLSNENPLKGDCYITIITDSMGARLTTGVRLSTKERYKDCIKITATDNKALNLEGCPILEEKTLKLNK